LFGAEDWVFLTGAPSTLSPDFGGYQSGGQAGYNLQAGRVVLGVEADYGYSNANGAVSCPNALFFTCEAELNKLGTLAGRVGVTWGRALFYAKGGWAFGEVSAAGRANILPPGIGVKSTEWSNGWALGGGMEFALTNSWSAKAEYLHYDLGKETYQVSTFGTGEFVSADAKGDTVRIGVNYHFHPMRDPRPLK
jgi:outer membrane immunogenic protein